MRSEGGTKRDHRETSSGCEEVTIHRLPAVRLEESVDALFQSAFRVMLANDVIGDFLPHQRWFRGKAKGIASISITDQCKLGAGFFLVLAGVEYAEGGQETYVLPLKVAEGSRGVVDVMRAGRQIVSPRVFNEQIRAPIIAIVCLEEGLPVDRRDQG